MQSGAVSPHTASQHLASQQIKMQAIHFSPTTSELKLIHRPDIPTPGSDDVVVQVAYSGVCGTDVHVTQGEFPCNQNGLVLGHEFSGIAYLVGGNVSHIKPGDHVVVDPNSPCHVCNFCASGNYHLCGKGGAKDNIGIFRDGGWATYCLAPAAQTFKLPSTITLEQGALCEPMSCVTHGWDRISPLKVGQTILIQGAGIIGNLWAAILHLQGHRRVTMSEPNDTRRKLFENLETSFNCVHPANLPQDYQADVIIDCSGAAPAIEKAVSLLAAGGKLCLFGVAAPHAKVTISPFQIFDKEITIVGVKVNPYSFPNALGLLESMGTRYLDYNKLGIQTFPLEKYQEALDALKTGSIAKAIFKIS